MDIDCLLFMAALVPFLLLTFQPIVNTFNTRTLCRDVVNPIMVSERYYDVGCGYNPLCC